MRVQGTVTGSKAPGTVPFVFFAAFAAFLGFSFPHRAGTWISQAVR